ncbi:histidinol-phosphate transaminase [Salisediminibacterium selenitireducens]|uniref:Histidinol-phosphate aminotransferase n=1 Tax=Bacillus selenitireducens (strain ATCC 700615 / DSM 15326 / MLS10) TaxID=439292 RepID=D6XUY9_BACIE|nr:histidinol-phosphate transaminase [Salisediminibacterium selenitireducens]ADH99625.1 histidinol-phosphate aminotransferase [[Bacillus] selenitireducens MLS10]
MRIKESMIGLVPYQPGKPIEDVKRELGLTEVIKLASNENPYGASPHVKEAIMEAYENIAVYPDGYARELRETVAEKLSVKPEQLIFGNGSDDVILILCRSFLTPEDNIVTADPTFSQYRHNAVIEGAKIKEVPLKAGVHDLDAMLEAIDEQTKMVFVCNPNNPTGTYNSSEEFRRFAEKVPEDVLIISDEAYIEYVTANDYPDTLPMLHEFPNLMILRTFSKAYGIAALRVGFGVANEDLIRAIDPGREPFNTNTVAQKAAIAALKDEAFIEECITKNAQEMKKYERFCEKNGFHYFPSQTNFILMDLQKPGSEIFDYLLRRGFITRNGEALGFPTGIRITLGSPEQNDLIISELEKWLVSGVTSV